jgi:hypothetical protein
VGTHVQSECKKADEKRELKPREIITEARATNVNFGFLTFYFVVHAQKITKVAAAAASVGLGFADAHSSLLVAPHRRGQGCHFENMFV